MTKPRFEDEVEELIRDAYVAAFKRQPSEDWLTAIATRVGTKGNRVTLDEAGRTAGVTRERMRQVMNKIESQLAGKDVTRAQAIAEALVAASPAPEPIGLDLEKSGLTRSTLTGAGFLNILQLVGTSPTDLVGTDLVSVDDWIVEESEVPIMKAVSAAKRHTSKYGMTTVEEIAQALSTPDNPLDRSDIRRVLEREPSIKWAGDWLWVDKQKDNPQANRLVNTARSVLSVNSPQTIASIHEGARRVWKFRQLDVLPSIAAMETFFAESPYFLVHDELVSPTEELDYREIHGSVAATMIDILKSSPYQVMDRQSLHKACADAGLSKATSGVWTTYAEWMEKFGPNVWGLRGSSPNPGAVDEIRKAARARLKAEPRRKKWAWATDGQVVQTMDVTTSFLSTGVLSFVPEIHSMLAGHSVIIMLNGEKVATVKLGEDHCFCWGWHPAIAAIGANLGDVLRITVNVATRTAELELGDQELWAG